MPSGAVWPVWIFMALMIRGTWPHRAPRPMSFRNLFKFPSSSRFSSPPGYRPGREILFRANESLFDVEDPPVTAGNRNPYQAVILPATNSAFSILRLFVSKPCLFDGKDLSGEYSSAFVYNGASFRIPPHREQRNYPDLWNGKPVLLYRPP